MKVGRVRGFDVFQELELKKLYVDKDIVLLVSSRAGDDDLPNALRGERNAALATLLLKSGPGRPAGSQAGTRSAVGRVELIAGFLGKPELLIEGKRGPSVSFSHAVDSTWAALCPSGPSVGVDATDPGEFVGSYPFHRVFHAEELRLAAGATAGDRSDAAALLWSAKEAVVKALGCGFHLIAPLDVSILPRDSSGWVTRAAIGFSETTLARFQALREATVRVVSLRESKAWVSTALSSWTVAPKTNPR